MSREVLKPRDGDGPALPAWMVQIRQAVTDAIKPGDLAQIFAKQVELAKAGDRRAMKFVFDQARAFSDLKGLTLIQNNYAAGEAGGAGPMPPAERPTRARPGSAAKVEAMRRRVEAGYPPSNNGDADGEDED